jgi:hypothetical protein
VEETVGWRYFHGLNIARSKSPSNFEGTADFPACVSSPALNGEAAPPQIW